MSSTKKEIATRAQSPRIMYCAEDVSALRASFDVLDVYLKLRCQSSLCRLKNYLAKAQPVHSRWSCDVTCFRTHGWGYDGDRKIHHWGVGRTAILAGQLPSSETSLDVDVSTGAVNTLPRSFPRMPQWNDIHCRENANSPPLPKQ